MVKNPPCNARNAVSIPHQGTRILHTTGELGPYTGTTEPMPQLERPHTATKDPT